MIRRLLVAAIRFYKRLVAPWVPNTCRFEPTCSVYAEQALARHGTWRGTRLAVARLLRCRPGGAAGLDPVPDADMARSEVDSG